MISTENALVQGLLRFNTRRNGNDLEWLQKRRHAAFLWISEHGFPTSKNNAWKYTQIAPILDIPFQSAESEKGNSLSFSEVDQLAGDFGGTRLIFVNGHFIPEISSLTNLPKGIKIRNLASVLNEGDEFLTSLLLQPTQKQTHAFAALNMACAEDGAIIQIPINTMVEEPIHLVFLSSAGKDPIASHPRSFVQVGAKSRATIIETYTGIMDGTFLSNAVTEIILGEGAVVDHYKIQNEMEATFHIARLDVRQEQDSHFTTHSIALGSRIARHETKIKLLAPGALSTLNGLYMPTKNQVLDNSTTVEHLSPHCTSRELYKGVVDGQGRGIFDGQILVHAGAFKTDASLTNRNLLLSMSAQAYTRPQLKIFADDVKCSHGATVSQLDEDAVFYLRSRGISKEAAQNLLTHAFVREMLELIQLEPLRSYVEKKIIARILPSCNVGRVT